jgi:RNA polymerase sigma-70 factor (ECF subfamily)
MEAHTTLEAMTGANDAPLLARLRSGDEAAFQALIERYHPGVVRVCQYYLRDRSLAEEAAQETWLAMLRGLDRFEARSSLKTWLYGIAANTARSRARREQRTVTFSSITRHETEPFEPAVDPSRFRAPDQPYPGGWVSFPPSWGDAPEQRFLSGEVHGQIHMAINSLPESQREVVRLRDVEGFSAREVCDILGVSEANQRVLLHRGRSKVRGALEHYLTGV